MISSDVIRGYNDTIILSLLLEQPSYGYEISKRIRELSNGDYIIKETTLYSAFNRLEQNGYTELWERNQRQAPHLLSYYPKGTYLLSGKM